MDSSRREKKISVANLLSGVVDKMLQLQPVVVEDTALTLAQRRANIRAVSVREGFQSIRARSDEMTERLEQYRRQREAMTAKHVGAWNDALQTNDTNPDDFES